MDISVLAAALRILTDLNSGRTAAASDVDLIRSHALGEERDYDLDDLARCVARRAMMQQQAVRRQFGCDTVTS